MLNLNSGSTSSTSRIESDRDVLPFPSGGVFGPGRDQTSENTVREKTTPDGSLNLTRSIESELDNLQQGLDQLTVEIEEEEARDALASIPFRRYQQGDDSNSPPPAA
ncbi:MAG: hypothetical protein ACIAQF_04115 [Phycisphaerales bacterium JB065]